MLSASASASQTPAQNSPVSSDHMHIPPWSNAKAGCRVAQAPMNRSIILEHMQVLVSILEAGGEMPGSLLEGLLIYLVPPDSKEHPEACRYAGSGPHQHRSL